MRSLFASPTRRHCLLFGAIMALTPVASGSLTAQNPPPVQGTTALEGTMKTFYRAVNVVVVTTMDGVEHVYHFARDLVVHGGKRPGVDALDGLREGTTVVVHFTIDGTVATAHEIDRVDNEGLAATEGIVTRIDHGRRQITIKYDNGTMETFQLTERAAVENATDEAVARHARVVIYYSNDGGRRVAHFFKQIRKP